MPALGRTRSASKQLAGFLSELIIRDGLAAGTQLGSESDLAEATRLSRGTVREALRFLEADGLIKIVRGAGGGATVAHPDSDHLSRSFALLMAMTGTPLADLMEFRRVIEPAAAGLAAERATPEQVEQLLELADHPESPHVTRFHLRLAEATNNDLFRHLLRVPHKLLEWQPEELICEDDRHDASRAHRAIANAILNGDAEGAVRAMDNHLAAYEAALGHSAELPIVPRSQWTSNHEPR